MSQPVSHEHQPAHHGPAAAAPGFGGLSFAPPSFSLTSDSSSGSGVAQMKTPEERLQEISDLKAGGTKLTDHQKREATGLIDGMAAQKWQQIYPEVQKFELGNWEADILGTISTAESALRSLDIPDRAVRLSYLRALRTLKPPGGSGLRLFLKYLGYRGQLGIFQQTLKGLGEENGVDMNLNLGRDLNSMGDVNTYIMSYIKQPIFKRFNLFPSDLKTPKRSSSVTVKGRRVAYKGQLSAKKRQALKDFLEKVLPEKKEASKGTPPVSISPSDLRGLMNLSKMSKAHREKVLDLIRSRVADSAEQGLPLSLEEVIAHADVQVRMKDNEDLEFDKGEAPTEKPKVMRPVKGKILPDQLVSPNQSISFQFQEEDLVDDLRVPRIQIQWRAVKKHKVAGRDVIATGRSNYIPLRGHNVISNDSTFKVKFQEEGEYIIYARVYHNFYKGIQLVEHPVKVVKEEKRLDKLTEEAGITGLTEESETFETASDPYDEGSKYRGKWDPKALDKVKKNSGLPKINASILELRAMIRKYSQDKEANETYIDWAKERIETLEEYKKEILADTAKGKQRQVGCTGFYASRKQGIPDQQLNLTAYLQQSDIGEHSQLTLRLFDLSEAEGSEKFTFEETTMVRAGESRKDAYEELLKKAFISLTEAYPNGTLRFMAQGFDGQKITQDMVGFEKVTDTLGKDIVSVVYNEHVKTAVDIATAVAMLFPPTAPLGLAVGLVYNGAEAAYNLSKDLDKGTAGLKNAVEIGAVALELMPVIGKAAKIGGAGRFVQIMKGVGTLAGMAGTGYLLTEGVWKNLKSIQEKDIGRLVEMENEMQTLRANNAPAELLAPRQRELEKLKKQIRFNTAAVISEAVISQGITMASKKFVLHLAQGKASRYKEHHARMKASDPTLQKSLPKDLVKDVPVLRDPAVQGNEVRVHFDTDSIGTVQSIVVRVSETAKTAELLPLLKEHHGTIRMLRKYQGISGALRLLIARKFGKDAAEGNFYDPSDLSFEAHGEVKKISKMIAERKKKLASGKLGTGDNSPADIQTEIGLLELYLEKFRQQAESGERKAGLGFIASPNTKHGKTTLEAMQMGYPDPNVHAPGHHYRRDPSGGYKLVRNPGSTHPHKMLQRTATGWKVVDHPMAKALTNMKPGEVRTHPGGQIERKNADGSMWIVSKVGRTSAKRQGFEHMVLPSPGEMGLKFYERAHSHGKITGWESSQGILYAPRELNQEYQRLGIEGFFREASEHLAEGVSLYMGTETHRHPGTSLLKEITYVMMVARDGEAPHPIMELTISVDKNTADPKISVSDPEIIGSLGPYMD